MRRAHIHYARVDEFWRKEEKYAYLDEKQHRDNVAWKEIQPDAKHNWLTEGMQDEFERFLPMGSKEAKADDESRTQTIFKTYGGGIKTSRDRWALNFNAKLLAENMKSTIDTYNEQV